MKSIIYLMLTIGLALLAISFYLYTNTQEFLKTSVTTQGTVIELIRSSSSSSSSSSSNSTYKPVVEFKTQKGERIEFTSPIGTNPPSYSMGEVVEVFYQKSSPQKAKINGLFSLWGYIIIVGLIGTVFTLLSGSFILVIHLKNKKKEFLKRKGISIQAKFQSVERNRSLALNKRNPYQIYAQWVNPMTSELYIFKSENLWFDPTDYINSDEITVLIERDNPKEYYVDTSFLPKLAN